jgi:hypothetical protein
VKSGLVSTWSNFLFKVLAVHLLSDDVEVDADDSDRMDEQLDEIDDLE